MKLLKAPYVEVTVALEEESETDYDSLIKTIINPADDTEAKAAVEAAILHDGPVYCRFGRLAVPVINDPASYKFELGKGIQLVEGTDVTVISTGLTVQMALKAAQLLKDFDEQNGERKPWKPVRGQVRPAKDW